MLTCCFDVVLYDGVWHDSVLHAQEVPGSLPDSPGLTRSLYTRRPQGIFTVGLRQPHSQIETGSAALMKDLGYASIPAVQQYLKTASSLGIDYRPALAQAGIDEALLSDNTKRVTGQALQTMLAALIPASGDPLYGLHTSQYIQPASYSVLGYIAMNCGTLGEALAKVPVYEKIVGDMGVTRTLQIGDNTQVHWHCNFDNADVRRHVIENVLASWTRYSRWVGDSWDQAPLCVYFEHALPAGAALSEYEQVFQCPVRFAQPFSALEISPAQIAHPIRQSDPALLKTLLDHATQLLAEIDQYENWAHRVKNLLRLMIKQDLPRKEFIAERLGVTPRTLQRKLADEGTGYQELLDDLRLEMARNYLRDSSLSIDEIGAMLGFAEPRSFHRSFKQWTGYTPGQYRESPG